METFSSFKESNLYSKKEWLLPNHIVYYLNFLTPIVFVFIFFDIYRSFILIKHKVILFVLIYFGYILADYITAFAHCFFIDDSYSTEEFPMENGYLIVNVFYGYASFHHYFPSGWKDVSDRTILTSMLIGLLIPILLIQFIRDIPIKLATYFIILFLTLSPISHKYAHEKLHNREVPFIIDKLSEYGILLPPKKHQTHHVENNYNWGLLSGRCDPIFDFLIRNVCKKGKCPMEKSVKNAKKNSVNDKVKLKFVGDIEGTLEARLDGNLVVKLNPS